MSDNHKISEEKGGGWYTETEVVDWKDALQISEIERPPSDSPYLNDSTIDQILDGNSTKEALDDQEVEETLANIEKRLTRLLYDIAILSNGGYIEDIDQNWEYLEKTPDHMNLALRNGYHRDLATNEGGFHFDLGFNTGLALSALTGTLSEDERASKFLSGLERAYAIDEIEKQPHEMLEDDSPPGHGQKKSLKDEKIENTLAEYGIESTRYIKRIIKRTKVAMDNLDGQPSLSYSEATKGLIEDKEFLLKCSEVREKMDSEWKTQLDAGVPGIEIDEVLKSLWELIYEKEKTSTSSRDIRRNIGLKSTKDKITTQVLNRLSEGGKNPSVDAKTTYKHGEIVYYDNGGNWVLTDYGRLLCYYIFEKNQRTDWIQRTALQINEYSIEPQISSNGWDGREILEAGVDDYFDD